MKITKSSYCRIKIY